MVGLFYLFFVRSIVSMIMNSDESDESHLTPTQPSRDRSAYSHLTFRMHVRPEVPRGELGRFRLEHPV